MGIKKTAEEYRRNLKIWMILSTGIYVSYGGLLFISALFFGGDMRVAALTAAAGSPIPVVIVVTYIFFPGFQAIPLLVGIMTNIIFIAAGSYLQFLDFYFFVMLLTLGTITTVKSFRQILYFVIISIAINIFTIIFLVPRLAWLDSFRFFMQFVMYFYASAFFMIQTYLVDQKEGRSVRALAAFSSLLRSTPNLMVITDADTRVLYLSDPMAKFINYEQKEYAIGQPLTDLVSDAELKFMFANILDAEGYYETIIELNVEDERRFFKIVTDKLTPETGEMSVTGAFIDIADITPTVKSQQAAVEANKSKSDFLAAMSHEIRTPMNAILGIAQIQLQKPDLADEYRSALNKMYSSGSGLLGIINDILDLSKIETGKMELIPIEYDTPSLIHDAAQLNIVRIGSKPISFIMDIDKKLPSRLIGDELRLKQILNNLLSNAIKYTDKGHVKLSVYHTDLNHTEPEGYVNLRFVVADTGQGMNPQDRERLFSEYLRFNMEANRTTEGTGIGLTIVKNLVELMDGTIEVESEYGVGSTFAVTVRQRVVQCEAIGEELSQRLSNFSFSEEKQYADLQIVREAMPYGKVLIVDDVETNLYVAEGLMLPYGLEIETALSGFAALKKVERGLVYDIIFMDHMMPLMDGIETTGKIRAAGYQGIIVALTANALAGNAEMFKQNGFDDFISKPIDVRRLNSVLNKFVRDRHSGKGEKYSPPVFAAAVESKLGPKILDVFRRDAEKAVLSMGEVFIDGRLSDGSARKQFTTAVHSMKAALANIGEHQAAGKAATLEYACLNGDMDYIAAYGEDFIEILKTLTRDLCAEAASADDSDCQEDTAFLSEQLCNIKKACADYDDTAAYDAFDRLKEKTWRAETTGVLEKIYHTLFLHSDFEAASDQIAEHFKKILPEDVN